MKHIVKSIKVNICLIIFLSQNSLKQADALSPLLFNFPLEYTIRKVQENQVGLKLNGTHQLLVYADYVNLLGDKINTLKKNTESLTDDSKEVGLEVNAERNKYMCMLLFHHQNTGKNYDIKVANRETLWNVAQFKYLRTTITNQNLIQEEIKRRLNLGHACYHSVENLLSFRLVSKNVKSRRIASVLSCQTCMVNKTPDLQGYVGQCSLGSPGFPLPQQRSYSSSGLLPARPSLQTLPFSSLLISHVAHSPSLPILI
jgi:hypothetical protein